MILSLAKRLGGGSPSQACYESVLAELATLRLAKVKEYGEARYEERDQNFNMVMTYSDLYRKFIRLRQLLWIPVGQGGVSGGKLAFDISKIRQELLDLANYAIMGVQLIDQKDISPTYRILPGVDQIAFAVEDPVFVRQVLGQVFGCTEWLLDTVIAEGVVHGHPARNVAELSFNYQAGPFELELLAYQEGPNWLAGRIGCSHLGIHVIDLVVAKQVLAGLGWKIIQEVQTVSHTNPAIKDTRRYHYVIYDTVGVIGFDVKLIQRIDLVSAEK